MDSAMFNLVHTGRFGGSYSGRDIAPLCEALTAIASDQPALARTLRLHQLGPLERRERALFAELIDGGMVVAHGLRSRQEALACQLEADALLLMTGSDRPGNTPGKIFEYLRAGAPIIGLTRGSYSESLIRETGTGWTVDPGDATAIGAMLRELATGGAELPAPIRDTERIAAYERARQVERLARLLDEVAVVTMRS
jgi:glycosyltransferase involved in cell wall biosynthesis